MSLDLVKKLIALATDSGATEEEEEARTAAVRACHLIRKYEPLSDAPPPPPLPPIRRAKRAPVGGIQLWRSTYGGYCRWCGDRYQEGARVWWYGTGQGCDHFECGCDRADSEQAVQ